MQGHTEIIDLCGESPTVDDDCIIVSPPPQFGGGNGGPARSRKRRREGEDVVQKDQSQKRAQQAAEDEALARRLQREEQERANAASAQLARQLHARPAGAPRFARTDAGPAPWEDDEEDEVPVWLRHNPFGLGGAPLGGLGGLNFGHSLSPSQQGRNRGRQRRRGSFEGSMAAALFGGMGGLPFGGGRAGFGGALRGLDPQALMLATSDRDFGADDYEALLALDEKNATRGVSKNELESNTVVTTLTSAPSEEQQCSVCLENQEQGHTVRRLPCLHSFHRDCIDQWLKKSQFCPICKVKGSRGGRHAR